MNDTSVLKQLFQQEFSKMVAVISSHFGLQHMELAEDIVSETFLAATETWGQKGIPPNPAAWLYAVAKQKTLYHFRRNKIYDQKVLPAIKSASDQVDESPDFSVEHIRDSQLQMIFAVCDPAVASEAQIGLALRILCGFGIDEIAEAFLANKETINKRLFRAKEKLRTEGIRMEMPPEHALTGRLDNVLHVIYLLFSEGYYSQTQDQQLRKDLCIEALRLGVMLSENKPTSQPCTNALVALMCFHASRFAAREAKGNGYRLYEEQDTRLWDQELIRQGMHFMAAAATGSEVSSYHLEAGIAYWHCMQDDHPEKWVNILSLYDKLQQVNFSPSVTLNRVYAVYKVRGDQPALEEALQLQMDGDHFYNVLLGELYKGTDPGKARHHLDKAYTLAKTQTEKQVIMEKIRMFGQLHGQ